MNPSTHVRASLPRWIAIAATVTAAGTLAGASPMPRWGVMWVMALALFAGFKWLAYRDSLADLPTVPRRTRLTFLWCWPGVSLAEFAQKPPDLSRACRRLEWFAATAKTLLGAGLVWGVVHRIPIEAGLVRGWVGMVGIILLLHFGTFHLLALTLQAAGFHARPNMQSPLRAGSLSEFWGRRWNTAFNGLADRLGFRPLTPRIGPRPALVAVFLASGLLHEAVITLPAGAGYGLPTIYFALQAAGLLGERRLVLRRRPRLQRLFTWAVLLLPLGCLFPPVFVRNVMLPMLAAIGATQGTP